jgi:hypothetical protein
MMSRVVDLFCLLRTKPGLLMFLCLALGVRAAALPAGTILYDAAFGNGTFVGVGANGAIFSSVAGGAWEARPSGTTNELRAVAFGGGRFIAAGANGLLLGSTNGVDWTMQSMNAVLTSPDVAYGNGRFVVAGKGAPGYWTMLMSTDGTNWISTQVESAAAPINSDGFPFGGLTFGAGKFLAVGGMLGGNLFLNSTNGITWTEQGTTGVAGAAKGPVTYGNGQFALVAKFFYDDDDDDGGGYFDGVFLSPDSASWRGAVAVASEWKAILATDCTLVAAGPYNLMFSHGGIYWTNLPLQAGVVINALVHGDGKFLALGNDIVELSIPAPGPGFPVAPESWNVSPGAYVYFQAGPPPCLAPPYSYQWQRNGVIIPSATNAWLSLFNVTSNDAGQYVAVARDAGGLMSTSVVATLDVGPAPPDPTPQAPVFNSPLVDTTNQVALGTDYGLSVSVYAWPPAAFQWRRDGADIPGATNAGLSFYNFTTNNVGNYTVVVSNALGAVTSAVTRLEAFSSAPALFMYNFAFTVREGGRANLTFFTYPSAGFPAPTYHVLRNGTNAVLPVGRYGSLQLQDVTSADAGDYVLLASNQFGVSTGLVANLTVLPGGPLDRWTRRNPLPQGEMLLDVAQGNGRFVAVGEGGTIVSSTNGANWTVHRLHTPVPISGIAFGNGLFVAVGDGNVLTSPDGVEWTPRVTRVDILLTSVAFGNGRFVVAGFDTILTSTDGLTWTEAALTFNVARELRDVTFGGGVFVAVGQGYGYLPAIWRSVDGVQWSPISDGPRNELESVAYGNGQFVAVGDEGDIYTSPDGDFWIGRNSTVSSRLLGVTFGNGRYVVVGTRGRILSSANGTTWTRETSGTPDRLESVTFGDGVFVAVGENGTILSSLNGAGWTKQSGGSSRDLDGMTVGNGLIVVAGKAGTILTSSNGIDFVPQATGTTNDLHGVTWANGLFVAVGEPEIILTSPNAIEWTVRHTGTNSSLKAAGRGDSGWVVVGTQGAIFTSSDGVAWSREQSPTVNDLNQVAFGNGRFVVVGDNLPPNGTLITSSDGHTWTRRNQYIGKNLRSVGFANGLFLATGNDGRILVSTNGLDWASRFTGSFGDNDNFRAVTYDAGLWVVVGNEGLVLSSSDTLTWTRHSSPTIENLHGVRSWNGRFVVIGNRGTILESDRLLPAPQLAGRATAGGFELRITTEPGTPYRIQATAFLPATNWNWETLLVSTNVSGAATFIDPQAGTLPMRFYRVVIP